MDDNTDKELIGRPPHEATDHTKGQVLAFIIAGYTQEQIAAQLGISKPTLRKHYAQEIDFGAMEAMGKTVGKLMGAIEDRQAWAICFYLKTRGKKLGWSERVEVTGKDGEPLIPDISGLSDAELAIIDQAQRIVARLAPEAADPSRDSKTTH